MHACSVLSDSLQPYRLQPTRLLCPWDSPGKNTGVGCHALLQRIFLTPGSNSHLPVSPAVQTDSLPTEPPSPIGWGAKVQNILQHKRLPQMKDFDLQNTESAFP